MKNDQTLGSFGTRLRNILRQFSLKNVINTPTRITEEVHNYKNIDISKLEDDFNTAPWDICNVFDDVEDSVRTWDSLYKDIMKDHIKNARQRSE